MVLKRFFYKLKRSSLRRRLYMVRTFKILSFLFLGLTIVYIYYDYNKVSFHKHEPVDCTCQVPENLR